MYRARREETYAVVTTIETDHGTGETRRIGPAHVTFVSETSFHAGEPLRFALTLRGTGTTPIGVRGSGRVESVAFDGSSYLVDVSIEKSEISTVAYLSS